MEHGRSRRGAASDAQLAREVEFALPRELTQSSRASIWRATSFSPRVRGDAGHGRRPERALGSAGADGLAQAARPRDADDARGQRGRRLREEGAGVEPNRAAAGVGASAGPSTSTIGWRSWTSMLRVDHRSFADRRASISSRSTRSARPGLRRDARRMTLRRSGPTTTTASRARTASGLLRPPSRSRWRRHHPPAGDLHRPRPRSSSCTGIATAREQFDQRAETRVRASPELVPLGIDGRGEARFTSRPMLAIEARLEQSAETLANTRDHGVSARFRDAAMAASARRGLTLSAEQAQALEHVTGKEGLASVVGYAGSGKSAMLGVARETWEAEGYTVRGAALSGVAAENLEGGSGHCLAHPGQPGAPVGARARSPDRARRAGDRRGRDDRLAADGAGPLPRP